MARHRSGAGTLLPDRAAGFAPVLLVLLVLVSCGCTASSPARGPDGVPPVPVVPASAPSVYIMSPAFDGGVNAGTVTVTVSVRNFVLAGSGRLACFLDTVPQTTPGVPVLTRPGSVMITDQPSCVWPDVTEGTHTFAAELVNPDNTPLVPPVLDAVDVTAVRIAGS